MENTAAKNNTLKCGAAIKILSIIALIGTFISCLSNLSYYNEYHNLVFNFLDIDVIGSLLKFIPVVLFALYILIFHKNSKAPLLIPIALCIFSLCIVLDFASRCVYLPPFEVYDYFFYINGIRGSFFYIVLFLVYFISSILVTINAFKRFNKKIFIVISVSVFLLFELLSIWVLFSSHIPRYIERSLYFYIFSVPMERIGAISFYIALLLFGLKNKIPYVTSSSPEEEKEKISKMQPQKALKYLNDKLKLGLITEEEYKTQRAEIISKL